MSDFPPRHDDAEKNVVSPFPSLVESRIQRTPAPEEWENLDGADSKTPAAPPDAPAVELSSSSAPRRGGLLRRILTKRKAREATVDEEPKPQLTPVKRRLALPAGSINDIENESAESDPARAAAEDQPETVGSRDGEPSLREEPHDAENGDLSDVAESTARQNAIEERSQSAATQSVDPVVPRDGGESRDSASQDEGDDAGVSPPVGQVEESGQEPPDRVVAGQDAPGAAEAAPEAGGEGQGGAPDATSAATTPDEVDRGDEPEETSVSAAPHGADADSKSILETVDASVDFEGSHDSSGGTETSVTAHNAHPEDLVPEEPREAVEESRASPGPDGADDSAAAEEDLGVPAEAFAAGATPHDLAAAEKASPGWTATDGADESSSDTETTIASQDNPGQQDPSMDVDWSPASTVATDSRQLATVAAGEAAAARAKPTSFRGPGLPTTLTSGRTVRRFTAPHVSASLKRRVKSGSWQPSTPPRPLLPDASQSQTRQPPRQFWPILILLAMPAAVVLVVVLLLA